MSPDKLRRSLSSLLSLGAVFHCSRGEVSFSAPLGLTPRLAMEKAGVSEATLALALAERAEREATARPIVESGPLTPGQERLILSSRLLSDMPVSLVPTTILIEGPLGKSRLDRALSHVNARFAALRAQLRMRADGVFVQLIAAPAPMSIPLVDLRGQRDPDDALRDEIARIASQHTGPLNGYFRTSVFRLAAERWCLAVSLHHMISDVWSVGLFYETLALAYDEDRHWDEAADGGRFDGAYLNAAREAQSRRRSAVGARHRAYWLEELASPRVPLKLRDARAGIGPIGFLAAERSFLVPATEVRACDAFARDHGTDLSGVLFTAWVMTLRCCADVSDLRVGVMAACRTTPTLESEMGFFSNPIVIRVDLNERTSPRAILDAARDKIREGLEHQEAPIQDVIAGLAPRDASDLPYLYQTMFTFNNVPTTALQLTGVACREINLNVANPRKELTTIDVRLSLTPTEEGLRCNLTYKADLLRRNAVEEMGRLFGQNLCVLRAEGGRPPDGGRDPG